MQKAKYKISALFLCGLLIYNSLGYFMALSLIRVAFQHQKWAELSSIPESQLTTFVFENDRPNSRLSIINKHEIKVDGKLFDVVSIINSGSTITYHCMHDSKEEKLIAKTRQLNTMAQPLPIKNTAKLIIANIIKNAIYNENTLNFEHTENSIFIIIQDLTYIGPAISITSPPPQIFC
jgi:hypothetical protein